MISVDNLTKYYGDLCALDHIGFQIRKGEVLGLLGPNGAGKTTCMRILTGYLEATEGTVRVKDMNIREHARDIKRIMGYLPENAPLYPEMLVLDYLEFVADSRGLGKAQKSTRIQYLADTCGIREVMHQTIGSLSKGYKQRVGLAQAMMGDPEILVLDEPTSGLDPNQIVEIRGIIREIGREKTVILSTHILSEAEATCDRVVIIHRGRIVADGNIGELQAQAGKETHILVSLSGADPARMRAELARVQGVGRIEERKASDETGVSFSLTAKGDEDIRPHVYQAIKSRDWELLEFYRETKSLEHIFRELTKENVQ